MTLGELTLNFKEKCVKMVKLEGEVKGVDNEGIQVLVEPCMDDDAPTNIPFTVCTVKDGKSTLRMVNISNETVNVDEGAEIGVASVNNACALTKKRGWKNTSTVAL